MITITDKSNNQEYIVYQTESEVSRASEVFTTSICDVREGMYYKTANNYYIPCYYYSRFQDNYSKSKIRLDKKYNDSPFDILIHKFPNYTITNKIDRTTNQLRYNRKYKWTPDKLTDIEIKHERQQGIVKFMEMGMSMFQAIEAMYKNKPGYGLDQILRTLINDENFYELLRKSTVMSNLKEKFRDADANESWLAKKMKAIVEDKNEATVIRNNVITLLFNMYAKEDTKPNMSMTYLNESSEGDRTAMVIENAGTKTLALKKKLELMDKAIEG